MFINQHTIDSRIDKYASTTTTEEGDCSRRCEPTNCSYDSGNCFKRELGNSVYFVAPVDSKIVGKVAVATSSNNRLTRNDVRERWELLRRVFLKLGMPIVAISADGDTMVHSAMMHQLQVLRGDLRIQSELDHVQIQDPLHILLKLFNVWKSTRKF